MPATLRLLPGLGPRHSAPAGPRATRRARLSAMPRHPTVSPTTATLSAGFYSALAEKAKARPGRVFALQVGDTLRDPPECARAEAWRTTDHPRLHAYSPVVGEPVLLDAIEARLRTRHGERVPQDGIQVMLGATGGLAVVVDALVD